MKAQLDSLLRKFFEGTTIYRQYIYIYIKCSRDSHHSSY